MQSELRNKFLIEFQAMLDGVWEVTPERLSHCHQ